MFSTSKVSQAESLGRMSSGGSTSLSSDPFSNIQPTILLVAAVIALIAAILLFVLIVERKKPFKGKFANWLREYLNFRSILIAGIMKFSYLFLSVFLTVMSIVVMCSGKEETVLPMILAGLALLIFGNILLRITAEMTMAIIVMWENTSDIRLIMVKKEEPAQKEELNEKEKLIKEEEPTEIKEPKNPAKAEAPAKPEVLAQTPEPQAPESQNPESQTPAA